MVAATNRSHSVEQKCNSCGETKTLLVCITDFADWQLGKYIQDAMPYLSADERELLISRTCGVCFDKMFGDEPW